MKKHTYSRTLYQHVGRINRIQHGPRKLGVQSDGEADRQEDGLAHHAMVSFAGALRTQLTYRIIIGELELEAKRAFTDVPRILA